MGDEAKPRENGPGPASVAVPAAPGTSTHDPVILFFGTSLTAGYGLQPDQAFPAIIQKRAEQDKLPVTAVNAGLSGETSAGAVRRIDWALKTPADVIVIETGANDALRGLSVESARSNIDQIVAKAKAAQPGARIVLVQMLAPPNLGSAYTSGFAKMYSIVARGQNVTLAPFFLEGVAGHPELNQADGVHPNAAGARAVADNVWRVLKPIVEQLEGQKKAE